MITKVEMWCENAKSSIITNLFTVEIEDNIWVVFKVNCPFCDDEHVIKYLAHDVTTKKEPTL